MKKNPPRLTPALIQKYTIQLREQERSTATIRKYTHDLTALLAYLDDQPLNKTALIG